ncbi:Ribosomal protein S18 acetylase RimI [Asanoa hainanensis]|uniref:Ribosomal protein S18 acetylase RimI n=1 Tax=Asanoa hainanensis TaxID=560556 RepID=A0A239KAS1_9ACTN|nr:GNAT family N-acetyltransferase [Asanoa hainanensis]SNT14868.1 Ribosomal protein S18 acetylase RimI [Asanoa hainanensis]
MTVRIRPATPADFPAIARFTVDAYREDGQLAGDHGYDKKLADVETRAEAGVLLVAVEDDQVLGSVTFVLPGTAYAEISGPGEAEFRMLAVDPAAQGRGAGEALVRACLERAGELGCAAVVICVRSFSEPAKRLYARLGFARVPERDWSPFPGVELEALRLPLTG